MIVMKFGGTSMGNSEVINRAGKIIQQRLEEGQETVVVVSAMSGVTDSLTHAARSAASGDDLTFRQIKHRLLSQHHQAVTECIQDKHRQRELLDQIETRLSELEALCQSIYILGELTARGMDAVSSLGERLTARILAALLTDQGFPAQAVDATELIITNDEFGAAIPLMEKTRDRARSRLLPLLAEGITPVVTGFIGATRDGITTTLGRGGSDYTAAILGQALNADEVWIWTDVDGIMSADPRLVEEARTLPQISYAEAAELSYFGAKVLHSKTIIPTQEADIPLRILNTLNPSHPGTLVCRETLQNERAVKGITAITDIALTTVEGRGMIGVPGIAAKVFTTVAREGVNVLMITQSSSEQNICFAIPRTDVERTVKALEEAFAPELTRRNVDRIWVQEAAIIAAVGAGIQNTPGVAARLFNALGKHGINCLCIAQGSSKHNISIVVSESKYEAAVRHIHKELGLDEE
ncbi:MAG: aspartate kinase [Chloroflexota bacterium]|nr:aspartate kinase [Chloroflexota bacterium]